MSACPLVAILFRIQSAFTLLIALLLGAGSARAQIIDLNRNGASDVWERIYQAEAAAPNEDSDGDGMPNRLEAVAGSDPFDARSVPRLHGFTVTAEGVHVSMAGVPGKRYELQASEMVCGSPATNWFTEASLIARTNADVTLAATADSGSKFFRMKVSDLDSDGDGLNDWEEYQLGLDPFSPSSNGELDGKGQPLNDYSYVRNRLAAPSLLIAPTSDKTLTSLAADGAGAKPSLVLYPSAAANGSGLTGEYFTNSSAVYSNLANFNPANLLLTTTDPVIDFRWGPATVPNLSNSFWSVRWTGQVEPQYSETYTFETRTDDGGKLRVNDQLLIDKWSQGAISGTNTISLQAGVRYNLRMEYFNRGGNARAQLYWYSANQPRQIIPANRLYPASGGFAPGGITSPLSALAFLGQPFSYTITAANSPLGFGATNLAPGLGLNPVSGGISGVPTLAGIFQVSLFATNNAGVGNAVLELTVVDTGSSVRREIWLRSPGARIADIPLDEPATLTNELGALEGISNFADNYGERVRGYLTAPVTGNYYFWIAANNAAELWISNDDEPVNRIRRAYVSRGTAPREWNQELNQRSPWLALQAGKRYYVEVLHKAGKGRNDHWSVGWLLDPAGTNTIPADVVPGYVLSPYFDTAPSLIPGTLYSANMGAQGGAQSSGVGSGTLRVSADGSQAILKYTFSGLTSPLSGRHIHNDQYLTHPSSILFDIDDAVPQPDGSYIWDIVPVGTLSQADILEIIREGKSYINLHTVNYPAGEINGHFTLAAGAAVFTPPPPPPKWKDDHRDPEAAARFLQQATFGSSLSDIKSVRALGYARWINKQFKIRPSSHLAKVMALAADDPDAVFDGRLTFNTWWQQSVTAPDQLRQRVAFALSEIMVVSESGVLGGNAPALSSYYDVLLQHSFGNFRELLEAVTLSPAMGLYLDMRRNDKANLVRGTNPNENYAREILQLFSIGLNRMWPDGALILNSKGDLVPTYDQDVIVGFSRVFTGWNYHQTNQANRRLPTNWNPGSDYTNPMVLVPTHHESGTKWLLDRQVLPPAQGAQADPDNAEFDSYCSQDLEQALDSIFYNENVGPFICRQLIQRLVASHPSRDYLYRVVQKFNDNGSGVRGDMKAVIKAILLDHEARAPSQITAPSSGKQREPVLRATAIARAFPAPPALKATYKQNGQHISVTTRKPHRLSSRDDVYLEFTGSPRQARPISQIYDNVGVTNSKSFTITAEIPGISSGIYNQSGTVLTIHIYGHGLAVGDRVYLVFSTGGARDGIFTVTNVPSGSGFIVTASDSTNRMGECYFPKWSEGSVAQTNNTITFTTAGPHGLKPGNHVYIRFPAESPALDGSYQVARVPAQTRFTITSSLSTNWSDSDPLLLPLVPPTMARAGTVTVQYSTWNMNYTDSGSGMSLSQTPLNAPTVFNYYFPDYKFPGVLASAGLTTPEFQLTSDTTLVQQMNFFASSVFNNSSNTNGFSSFTGGNGAIMLDLGPWMTPERTSNAGVPGLVDALNSLLCAGQLSPAAKDVIANYVADDTRFPFTGPTAAQMRDRVRAVVHLIVTSPDFIIQR